MTQPHPHTCDLLFIYGTLRRGHAMHRLLDGCVPHAPGRIGGRLYAVAGYPGLVLSDQPDERVVGELVQMPDPDAALSRLDAYEECSPAFPEPHEYVRTLLPIELESGGTVQAWVYLYNHAVDGLPLIASGDFLQTTG